MKLQFLYVFGNEQPERQKNEITSLCFSQRLLAVGQSDGYVFVFDYKSHHEAPAMKNGLPHPSTMMRVVTTFTPFANEVDMLYGTSIRPDIVDMHFMAFDPQIAIVANQRNVQIVRIADNSAIYTAYGQLQMPKRRNNVGSPRILLKKTFGNVSFNQINAIVLYEDCFSALDEFTIKRYNCARDGFVQIYDITPTNLYQRYETITHGQYESQNLLSFSTSEGAVRRIDDRCSLAREGSYLLFNVGSSVYDYKLDGNYYYIRTHGRVDIYDARKSEMVSYHDLNPHNRARLDTTRFSIDVCKGVWATGSHGAFVQVGFRNSADVFQFQPKFKLKRTKNSDFSGVGGLQIVQNRQIIHGNIREIYNYQRARCVAFSDDYLAVGCGGNLFLYGWLKE